MTTLAHLLLVEDDPSLGETLKERLQKEQYQVLWATCRADAQTLLEKQSFDLVILDVGLPDGSGFELARLMRSQKNSLQKDTPFLFMTALNTAENRLEGYEIGAEEFIPKPFHLKELLMRVSHVLRNRTSLQTLVLRDRAIHFQEQAIVHQSGEKEFLQPRDFQLLRFLMTRAPAVVSRDEILDEIWGEDKFPSHRTVDNAIVRLRQGLGDTGGRLIRSVRGIGYQWIKDPIKETSGSSK
jgi:DNA-binding response OmpR family regulator